MKAAISRDLVPWPWRKFEPFSALNARSIVDAAGSELVQVCSTQYLGMPWNKDFRELTRKILRDSSGGDCGSLGSNFLAGTSRERIELENVLASLTNCDDAMVFNSGWSANYGVCDALGRLCEVVISDANNHNSVVHGLNRWKDKVVIENLREKSLEDLLVKYEGNRVGIIYPSLTGLTGIRVNVDMDVVNRSTTECIVVADECHSFGMIGNSGFEVAGVSPPHVRVVGLSKAVGCMGGAICGDREIIDCMRQLASPWIFSTSVPPLIWEIGRAALQICSTLTEARNYVTELATEFRARARQAGLDVTGDSHISSVMFSHVEAAVIVENRMRAFGFLGKASLPPSRPASSPCMRVVFTPDHVREDVSRLTDVLAG